MRRHTSGLTLLIDSTSLKLNRYSEDWAKFSTSVCGAKAHVMYFPDNDCPIYAAVTPARVNDITAAHEMPIEPGATYVFDLGYYDFAWWQRMHEAGCRIVTRLKTNTKLNVRWERLYDPGLPILSDRIGRPGSYNLSHLTFSFVLVFNRVTIRQPASCMRCHQAKS